MSRLAFVLAAAVVLLAGACGSKSERASTALPAVAAAPADGHGLHLVEGVLQALRVETRVGHQLATRGGRDRDLPAVAEHRVDETQAAALPGVGPATWRPTPRPVYLHDALRI